MPKLTPQMFAFLQEPQVEAVLLRLYTQALKQNRQMFFHFLPKIFKLLEPNLADRAVIAVDDVEGFSPAMQDYLDYVRRPENGYISSTLKPYKALEYTVKTGNHTEKVV